MGEPAFRVYLFNVRPNLHDALVHFGPVVVAKLPCSPCSIWSKVPIRNMEDLKGLEIRTTGFAAKIIKALGGTPVGSPMSAVYEMLAKNIVVGAMSSVDVLKSYKHSDHTKYITLSGLYVSSFYVVMNWDSWNALPPELKKILDGYAKESYEVAGETWDTRHEKALEFAKEKGLGIITLSPDELARWKKATMPLQDWYVKNTAAKGLPGKEFLAEMNRLIEKYSR